MDPQQVARRRSPLAILALAAVAALGLLAAGGSGTLSGWAAGSLTNSSGSAATGSVAFTHAYTSGPTCTAGPRAASVACTGTLAAGDVSGASGLTATDTITSSGNLAQAQLSQSVAATGCEPVQFANTARAANPLLARNGTTFGSSGPFTGAGGVTLDGANPGGYATSVLAQTQPPTGLLSAGTFSGIGVWFKAASGHTGPLFSFGASPANGSGNYDRTLYLNASGQLNFVWNTGGSSIGPSTKSGGYADGNWHFAYAVLGGINVAFVGLIPQVTLYVDGVQQAATPLISLSAFSSYSGYWHLGFAPTTTTGLSTAYFGGALSDFVVFDTSSAPAGTTNPNTAGAFATFAAAATEWWPANDTGTTTYPGTLPVVGAGNASTASAACKSIDLGWTFSNPAGTASASTTSLYALVTTGAAAVPAPDPSTAQTATLALQHDSAYDSYVTGLHLWVPMTSTITTLPGNRWALTFAWTPTAATTIMATS